MREVEVNAHQGWVRQENRFDIWYEPAKYLKGMPRISLEKRSSEWDVSSSLGATVVSELRAALLLQMSPEEVMAWHKRNLEGKRESDS